MPMVDWQNGSDRLGLLHAVDHTTRCHGPLKEDCNRQGPYRGPMFASRLEVFFCLSFGWNTSLSYASFSAVVWFTSLIVLKTSLFLDVSALTWHGGQHAQKESSDISHIVCHRSQKLAQLPTKISPKTSSQYFLSFSVFHLSFLRFSHFSIPHLEWSPDVERGEGEITCLAIRSEGAMVWVHGEKMLERH